MGYTGFDKLNGNAVVDVKIYKDVGLKILCPVISNGSVTIYIYSTQ